MIKTAVDAVILGGQQMKNDDEGPRLRHDEQRVGVEAEVEPEEEGENVGAQDYRCVAKDDYCSPESMRLAHEP